MPLFTLTCLDKPDALEARMAAREAHLAYVRGAGGKVKLGGPFTDDDGAMIGSLIIIEAADRAEAEAFAAGDPYGKAGVFASVEIRPFKLTLGTLG
jgi:uncharacterized protein YciI